MHRTLAAIAALLVCLSTAQATEAKIVDHPAGCPRVRFCGCGASVYLFGKPIRDLFLASNWRKFPAAEPAPRMAAWRPGHVFVIVQVIDKKTVLAYDANSGRHKTRIHQRKLAGYRVVNPHGSRQFASAETTYSPSP